MWLSRCAGASLAADKGEGNVLVVWDFDWSLVNENSDTFVLRELAPALTDEMKQLQAERPAIFGKGKWTALMDHLLTKLGEEHMVSRRQIEHCLEGIPVFVEVIQVVRELAGRGCEQRILSDANSVFIDEVLRAACLQRHFSAVATCVEIKILRHVRAESSRCSSRHRRAACSTAWRCWFLTARPSQDGRVIAEK